MPMSIEELRADIDELKLFAELSTRQSMKDFLLIETRRLENEIIKLQSSSDSRIVIKATVVSSSNKCYDVKITNYAWDQSDNNKWRAKFINSVAFKFDLDRSVELTVKSLEGKNYNLVIKNLADTIYPTKSHWKVKNDMVVVFLAKQNQVKWETVTLEEKKIKKAKAPKLDSAESGDPQAGLMNLMKKLYDEGDEDMKRTMAKAFVESRSKTSDVGL